MISILETLVFACCLPKENRKSGISKEQGTCLEFGNQREEMVWFLSAVPTAEITYRKK